MGADSRFQLVTHKQNPLARCLPARTAGGFENPSIGLANFHLPRQCRWVGKVWADPKRVNRSN